MENKITREDYNKALDVVEAYNLNLFKIDDSQLKTPISKWVDSMFLSKKLKNVLLMAEKGEIRCHIRGYSSIKFIEDINIDNFFKIRGAGKESWKEFLKVRKLA